MKHTIVPNTDAEKFKMAKEQYDRIHTYCKTKFKVGDYNVCWDGRGKTNLGYCCVSRDRRSIEFIRFNKDYLLHDDWFLDMVNETIPHELAHAVCYDLGVCKRPHDIHWKQICIELGGNGRSTAGHIKGRDEVPKANRKKYAATTVAAPM